MKDSANFINQEMKKIVMSYTGNVNTPETASKIKEEISRLLRNVLDELGYANMPKIVCKSEKTLLSIYFYSKDDERIETFGDLLYYMDTGKV